MNFRLAVSILIIFLLLAGAHLFIYAQNISLNYQITDLKLRLSELKSRNRQLAGRAAEEENLSRVEKTAKEKLGMIYPEKITYIVATGEAGPGPNRSGSGPARN